MEIDHVREEVRDIVAEMRDVERTCQLMNYGNTVFKILEGYADRLWKAYENEMSRENEARRHAELKYEALKVEHERSCSIAANGRAVAGRAIQVLSKRLSMVEKESLSLREELEKIVKGAGE